MVPEKMLPLAAQVVSCLKIKGYSSSSISNQNGKIERTFFLLVLISW